jgi:hypothetical protein
MPTSAPKTVGEIDSFITMLLVACENERINERLETLLSLPDLKRQAEINEWVKDLIVAQAPRDFVSAVACLVDNQVAEKAYEVIYKCKREDNRMPSNSASLTDTFLKALRALSGAAKRGR